MEVKEMSIGENIKRLRLEQGISQEELARKVDVTRPMITQIERGTKVLTLPLGKEIARVLQCEIDELIDDYSIK